MIIDPDMFDSDEDLAAAEEAAKEGNQPLYAEDALSAAGYYAEGREVYGDDY